MKNLKVLAKSCNKPVCASLLVPLMLLGTARALAGPPIQEYTVYGEDGVFIGASSTVNGLTGARNNDPVNGNAIKLNGGANINGDARSGGNVNLQNSAHVTGTVFRAVGTILTLGAGSSV